MFASSITTVGRPLGVHQPNVQFIDTSTICSGLENGALLEDVSTGHQTHLWLSAPQGAQVSVGQPLIAADPPHKQVALYQPGSSHVHILCVESLSVLDKFSARLPELPTRDMVVTWLHLSFSSDGLRLAAIARAHWSFLCVYERQDPSSAFELLCTTEMQSKGTPFEPNQFPGNHNFLAVADDSCISIVHTDGFCGQVDCKQRSVDLFAMDASNTITAHTWTESGDIIFGTAHGLLFLVHKAAPASGDVQEPGSQLQGLHAVPLLLSELSKWNAGSIIAIHASANQLTLVMECPDGNGGLIFSFSVDVSQLHCTDTCPMCHVEVPTSRTLAARVLPDSRHLAIVDDMARVVIVPAALQSGANETARVASFGLSGPILSVIAVKGTSVSGNVLAMALQDSGALHLYMLEESVRVSDEQIAPRVTLLRSASLGQPGAAMDAHPSIPIVAVATATGVVQLIHAEGFRTSPTPDTLNTAAQPSFVQFSAYCLSAGPDKVLKWSPDGTSLVAMDIVSGVVSFLWRKAHPHHAGQHTLSVLGHYSVPNVNLVCWHQSEDSTPCLIVHLSNGHLLVLDAPQGSCGTEDDFIPAGTLQRSKLRLTTPLVDMRVLGKYSTSAQISVLGVTWDCSIRRLQVSTEQVRVANSKKSASNFAPAAPVEAEVVQGLPAMPACMELSSDGDSMFVATRSGSVFKVQVSSLEILHPSLPVCGLAQNCCSTMLSVAATGFLVAADRTGTMQAIQLAQTAPTPPAHVTALSTLAPEGLRGAVSGVLQLSGTATSESFSLPLGAQSSPSLAEAEKALLEQSREMELGVWKEQVDLKMRNVGTALRRVKERNSALASDEQLPADAFTVADVLAIQMRAAGQQSIRALRELLHHQVLTEACKAKNVLADTWDANERQEKVLQPLQLYDPVSTFDSGLDTRLGASRIPVQRMAEPRANAHEAQLRQHMTFLRRVEQIEFSNRPVQDRGLCATIEVQRADGAADETAEADGGAHEYTARFSETSRTMSTCFRTAIAYSDVKNGACEDLYSPFQQHLLRRKLAQIRLLATEVVELRRSYNEKFDAVCASKEAAIAKIEGNLERVGAIQVELGQTLMPTWLSSSSEEDETRCVRVELHEMTTSPWISPAQRSLMEQENLRREELRRAAEADTSRARALEYMMNNNPERRKADAFEHLAREPWMNMPLKSMTKAQREALREFDKKVLEVEESLKKAVRIAEGERKVLEEDIIAVINNFNGQLFQLYNECVTCRMQISSAERARLALVSSVVGVQATQSGHEGAEEVIAVQSARMSTVRRNLDLLQTSFSMQQAEYMNLQRISKQLDRALAKAFQHLESHMHVVEATYRDTAHCATYESYGTEAGDGVRPDPADFVENAVGATAARSRVGGAAADTRDEAGGNSGLKSWRPGNQPPQAPTWIHGPAFGDDDRPEGIEQDDWSHLMVFRDCKLGVLEQIEQCWKSSCTTAALLEEYKAELDHTSKLMNFSMELQSQSDKQVAVACMNVPTVLTCKGGQVEVTEQTLIPDLEDAVMLATSSVNLLNTHVVLQAEKVLECLRACRDFKQGIHLSSWGISQAELAQKHKEENVRELQLLHVPRAIQNVLLSGEAAVSQDMAQVKSLEKVRDLHTHMHANSTLIKAKKFSSLTEDVATRLKANEELTTATEEAKQFMKKQAYVGELVAFTDIQQAKNRQNRLKQITFKTRLREVAMAQMRELSNLRNQKNIWIKRSFPTFAASNEAAT